MKRRSFLQLVSVGGAAGLAGQTSLGKAASPPAASPSPMKITRIRFYLNRNSIATLNQTFHIVTVETDQGITGIGEGGSKDTIEQCAAMLRQPKRPG